MIVCLLENIPLQHFTSPGLKLTNCQPELSNFLTFQLSNNLHAIVLEHFFLVRRIGQFRCQVLAGEVQPLVHIQPPFGAIADVIHDAIVSDKFMSAALACVAAQFEFGDEAVGNFHGVNYTG